MLESPGLELVHELAHEVWVLARGGVAHDPEGEGDVDVDRDVVLRLARLHGEVEDDGLPRDEVGHADPRRVWEVQAGRPDDRFRAVGMRVFLVRAVSTDEGIASGRNLSKRCPEVGSSAAPTMAR